MTIAVIEPEFPNLLWPILSIGLGIILMIPAIKYLDHKEKVRALIGFLTAFSGIAFITIGLIPTVSALAGGQDPQIYRAALFEEYGIRLEDDSHLPYQLMSLEDDGLRLLENVPMAYECSGSERVNVFDLFITRHDGELSIYMVTGEPFAPCEVDFIDGSLPND